MRLKLQMLRLFKCLFRCRKLSFLCVALLLLQLLWSSINLSEESLPYMKKTASNASKEVVNFRNNLVVFKSDTSTQKHPLVTYFGQEKKICEHFTQQGDFMMIFTKMVLNSSAMRGIRGGEDHNNVKLQAESAEYPQIFEGFFNINCSSVDIHSINIDQSHGPFMEFLKATKFVNFDKRLPLHFENTFGRTVFIVERIDYVNWYHVSMDWYVIYISARQLGISPANIHVLILDAHPAGMFDSTWVTLFEGFSRIGEYRSQYFSARPNLLPSYGQGDVDNEQLQSRLIYLDRAIWGPRNYLTLALLRSNAKELYLAADFGSFVLARHSIPYLNITLWGPNEEPNNSECRPRAILLLRRNYFSHPRQKSVSRKMANEQEVLYWLRNATITIQGRSHPLLHSVVAMQPDILSITEQLRLVHSADILIGVHGAGLAHMMYMPPMSGVVEFFPAYFPNSIYKSMSKWFNHTYRFWKNMMPIFEPTKESIRIPPKIAVQLVTDVISNIQRKFISCS